MPGLSYSLNKNDKILFSKFEYSDIPSSRRYITLMINDNIMMSFNGDELKTTCRPSISTMVEDHLLGRCDGVELHFGVSCVRKSYSLTFPKEMEKQIIDIYLQITEFITRLS
jgi:hypothetical protein